MTRSGVLRTMSNWLNLPHGEGVRTWATVCVVDAVGTGMMLPLSVIYFVQVAGLRPETVGLALGAAGLVGAFATQVAGYAIDRLGARKAVIGCFTLASIGYVGYCGVRTWPVLVLVASLVAAGEHSARPSKQAFVAEFAGQARRVQIMAFQRSINNGGFAVGGLVTAFLLATGSRSAYYAVLVANAVSYLVAALLVSRMRVGEVSSAPRVGGSGRIRDGYLAVARDRRYLALAALNVLVMMHAVAFTVGMPLWVVQHTSASPSLVAILFTLNTLVIVGLQTRCARGVAHARDAAPLYLRASVAMLVAAGAYLLAARLDSWTVVIVVLLGAVLAHTAAELLGATGEWTASVNLAPELQRGRYLAAFSLSASVNQTIAPAVVTVLLTRTPATGWLTLAVLLTIGCVGSAALVRGTRDADEGPVIAQRSAGEASRA